MATGVVIPVPKAQFFDNDGDALAGGLLYAYAAGTSTPQDTFSDVGLTTPNTNPVVLDAAGRATIYLTPSTAYKFVLKTSTGTTLWTQDNVTVAAVAAGVTQLVAGTGISQSHTGATSGTGVVTVSVDGAAIPTAGICNGRPRLESGVPVSVTDQSAKTTAYFTPYNGNQIGLYDGTSWGLYAFSEIAIDLAALTASKPYDVFAYVNAGSVAIETLVWTNATTRATAFAYSSGVPVKSGDATRRLVGTIYINGSGGQTDDTAELRYVCNAQNEVPRTLARYDSTATWNTTGGSTWASANAAAGNRVACVTCLPGRTMLELCAMEEVVTIGNSSGVFVGIGEDVTNAVLASGVMTGAFGSVGATPTGLATHTIRRNPSVGMHVYNWIEWSNGALSAFGSQSCRRGGMVGTVLA